MHGVLAHLCERALGMLKKGIRTADVARSTYCNVYTVRCLRKHSRETGRTADCRRSGRHHVTTPALLLLLLILTPFCSGTHFYISVTRMSVKLCSVCVLVVESSYLHTNIYTLHLLKIKAVVSERTFIVLLSVILLLYSSTHKCKHSNCYSFSILLFLS